MTAKNDNRKRELGEATKQQPDAKKAATGLVASQGGSSQLVPIQAVPSSDDRERPAPRATTQAPVFPNISKDGNDASSVVSNVRSIVPYVKYHLQETLRSADELSQQFPDTGVHQHQPLEIKAVEGLKADQMRSFKHPWNPEKAKAALEGASMYEAAGNVFWCDPLPPLSGEERIVAGAIPTWQEIEDLADSAFGMESAQKQTGAVKSQPFFGIENKIEWREAFPVSFGDDIISGNGRTIK